MRSLVTGGAGFIGSHLVDRLLQDGDRVLVLDDLSTGREANLAAVAIPSQLEVLRGSAADEELCDRAVRGCDRVFHLAAGVGVKRLFEHPVATIDANLATARAVFAAAARRGARLVYTSSSEVYGRNVRMPFREDEEIRLGPPTSPRWSYACAKAMGEWMALAEAREHGLRVTIARLFNTVGPRQSGRYGMVLPRFAAAALRGEPIAIYGDGRQTRCFADVREVADALVALSTCRAAEGEIVNVGSGEEIAIADLAERVARAAQSSMPPRHVALASIYGPGFEDLQRRVPDLRKLEALLGWRPRRELGELIDEVVQATRRGEIELPAISH